MTEFPYKEILDTEYPFLTGRPRMSLRERAAQFAPFAALTGFESVIGESARFTDGRLELDEEAKAELDRTLQSLLRTQGSDRAGVTITCFRPDPRKAGGMYLSVTGTIKKIDEVERTLLMSDGTAIPMEDVYSIKMY